jgi:hypothetical protein
MTPKSAWEDIIDYIPKDEEIWEAFYGDGESGKYLDELGCKVVQEPVDFFENDLGDIVVSNPPFSKCPDILKRLVELEKPFILIMPSSKINTQYFRSILKDKIQIIIPKKRIQFIKKVDDSSTIPNSCNFDCFYYCYKMNLGRDIIWL